MRHSGCAIDFLFGTVLALGWVKVRGGIARAYVRRLVLPSVRLDLSISHDADAIGGMVEWGRGRRDNVLMARDALFDVRMLSGKEGIAGGAAYPSSEVLRYACPTQDNQDL